MPLSQISLDGFNNILVVAHFAHYAHAHAHKLSPILVKSIAGRNRGLGSSSIYLFHSASAQRENFTDSHRFDGKQYLPNSTPTSAINSSIDHCFKGLLAPSWSLSVAGATHWCSHGTYAQRRKPS
ncbi:hypothetical protein [Ferrimicrobium acidiphilum]|uniref:hypothetical protein n=1 Tax=Ferrimicrobium acidiphilum TaxID=121039 RepID=UPI0023EFC57A|nr:hypothetical protein [Ferrimicrobium acidiphilum]